MRSRSWHNLAALLLLILGLAALVGGCFGGDGGTTQGTTRPAGQVSSPGITRELSPEELGIVQAEQLSTFRAKDPFIPQAVSTTTEASPSTSIPVPPTTAPVQPTITTVSTVPSSPRTTSGGSGGGSGSGTGGSTSTSTAPTSTTSTTAPHLHTMKILSIGEPGGAPAVTFQVDGSVYRDRRVGDLVSTSWGQIKVLDISPASKVVTLLHGSETLVLAAGQMVFE